jgi:glycosyltransferase involved in cell wall biosynthesis
VEIPLAVKLSAFEHFNEAKESNKWLPYKKEGAVIIGYIGRLEREKNLFTLLKAFNEVAKQRQNIRLLIIGEGSLKRELISFAKTTNASEKVCFLGAQRDIPDWLKALDIFILPSFTEGLPIALLEAMAASKAIIASDIPAVKEVVENGKEALLFNPNNVQQLTNLILTLYDNPELRKRIGENASRKAKQYDVNILFKRIAQVYLDVLKKTSATRKP